MKTAIFLFLSFSLYSQVTIPDVIADSIIFEVKLGRQCSRLDSVNRIQIATLDAMVTGQAKLIRLEREEIAEWKQKEDLWKLQFRNQSSINKVDQTILKAKNRGLKRWLIGSAGLNVVLLVVLLL